MSQTLLNKTIYARSMNGVITLSDGTLEISNGNITNANNLDANSIITDYLQTTLLDISGNVQIDGNLNIKNSLTAGDAITDTHTINGKMTFANVVPECSITPTTSVQLISKGFADGAYGQLSGTNTWSGANTFNVAPTMSGANISAASIPDTALSSNVALRNASNTFTGATNTFQGNLISNRNIATNTFIGGNTGLYRQATSLRNVAVGDTALRGNATVVANNTGTDNIAIGIESMQFCEQGTYNVSLGNYALRNLRTSTVVGAEGGRNVAIGHQAMTAGTNQNRCVVIGYRAMATMASTTSGNQNVIIGHNSYSSANTGGGNVIVGSDILPSGSGNSSSTLVGFLAHGSATSAQEGVSIGASSGNTNQAQFNTFVGYNSGQYHTTGVGCVFIGQRAGTNNSLSGDRSGSVVIGGMNCVANAIGRFVLGGRCQHPAGVTNAADGLYPKVCIPNKVLIHCCETLPTTASITMRQMYTIDDGAEYAENILIPNTTITSITLPISYAFNGTGANNASTDAKPASIGATLTFIKAYEGALTSVTINAPAGQTILVEGQTTAVSSFNFDSTMRVCSFTLINFFVGSPYGNGIYWVLKSRDYNQYNGANIQSATIPDSALSYDVFKSNKSQDSTITGGTTLSYPMYSAYSVNAGATAFTITLPTITSAHLGEEILFRRVGGTTSTIVSFIGNGTQKIYNTGLTGSASAQGLMGASIYQVRLIALVDATAGTYAWFQN